MLDLMLYPLALVWCAVAGLVVALLRLLWKGLLLLAGAVAVWKWEAEMEAGHEAEVRERERREHQLQGRE